MGATIGLLTFEEFERLPDEPGKTELLDGEVFQLPPAKSKHVKIIRRLSKVLRSDRAIEEHLYTEAGYKIGLKNWLIPDISINYPDQAEGEYFEGAPMLAIEVISESNSAVQMQRKVRKYFDAGGAEVWLVYSVTQCIWVHRKGHANEFRDKLESEVVPGVTIDVKALFAGVIRCSAFNAYSRPHRV